MATESIAEFLARGGAVEKSTSETTLTELLQKEGLLNQADAEKATNDLSEALVDGLNKDIKKD